MKPAEKTVNTFLLFHIIFFLIFFFMYNPSFADGGSELMNKDKVKFYGVFRAIGTENMFVYDSFCQKSESERMKIAEHYRKKADKDSAEAAFIYALLNLQAPCFSGNKKQGENYLTRAASLGHGEASYMLGVYEERKAKTDSDYFKAYSHYKIAVFHKTDRANYNLALLYLQGKGVKYNLHKAAEHLRLSAETGYPAAANDYAVAEMKILRNADQSPRPSQKTKAELYQIERYFERALKSANDRKTEAVAAYNLATLYANYDFFLSKKSKINHYLSLASKMGFLPAIEAIKARQKNQKKTVRSHKTVRRADMQKTSIRDKQKPKQTDESLVSILIGDYDSWFSLNANSPAEKGL